MIGYHAADELWGISHIMWVDDDMMTNMRIVTMRKWRDEIDELINKAIEG
jgi:hypothetical protein